MFVPSQGFGLLPAVNIEYDINLLVSKAHVLNIKIPDKALVSLIL